MLFLPGEGKSFPQEDCPAYRVIGRVQWKKEIHPETILPLFGERPFKGAEKWSVWPLNVITFGTFWSSFDLSSVIDIQKMARNSTTIFVLQATYNHPYLILYIKLINNLIFLSYFSILFLIFLVLLLFRIITSEEGCVFSVVIVQFSSW